ncbi:MAG: cation-transporting P-type ATPase [Clostridia bacterium]|nr:cation-transporting P-type ATPase [Clostridia bacterium]
MNLLDISPEQLCQILRCDPARGLSALSVLQNRKEFGENTPPDSLFDAKNILKGLFSNVLFCMFLALSVFSLFTENRAVATVCLIVAALFYTAFYFFCMYKARPLTQAKRALDAKYHVLRDGKKQIIRIGEIVPGDILYLSRGEYVPCDGILLSCRDMKVCQVQIDSRMQATKHAYAAMEEAGRDKARATLYCGSVVLSGEGILLVCNTGKNIVKNSLSVRRRAHLPRPLAAAADYARRLSLGLCCIATLIFLLGTFLGVDAFSNFFLLCTVAVAVLPELCEALTRLVMVLPLADLKKRGCLVQNYACLDALLETDRILVDSPSYFLDAEIRPSTYFFANYPRSVREVSEGLFTLISYCRLCCEDNPKRREQMWYGKSSIDAAILRTAPEFGIDAEYLNHSYLTISRTPFDEARGFSAALILERERCYQIVRGRPSDVLARCTHFWQEKRSVALSTAGKARLYQAADQMAADGEVVVAIARRFWRSVPADVSPEEAEYMTFVGFLTFRTPMRAESAEAVASCLNDGVKVLLCTDNDPDATLGIAKNMEFFADGAEPYILTGEKARRMDPVTLLERLTEGRAFCALSSAGKRSLVLAQKEAGHTVLACTHSSNDTLTQEAAQVNVVCAHDKNPALIQNADIVLTREKFELLPELLRMTRTVFLNSLRILRFSILLMVALFSTALFSLFFGGATVLLQPLPALLLGLGFFLVACIFQCKDKKLVTSLSPIEKNDFLRAKLGELSAYGATVGLLIGAGSALSYLITALFCHPAEASGAALVTLYLATLSAFFSARKTKPLTEAEFHINALTALSVPILLSLLAVLLLVPAVSVHLGLLVPPVLTLPISLFFAALPLFVGEAFKHVHSRFLRKK